jgi:GAF domain-containing protein
MQLHLDRTLEQAAGRAGSSLGNIQMMDWRRGMLTIRASLGFDSRFLEAFRYVSLDAPTACARAAMSRKPVLIENVFADRDFAPYRDAARDAGFHAVLSTPMVARSNVLVGVLSLHFAEGDQPSDDLIQETFGIAREAADTLLS